MDHGISIQLMADISKYKQGMEQAQKIAADSLSTISDIFARIKSAAGGVWDSIKSGFAGLWDKAKSAFGGVADTVSSAFAKITGMLPGFKSAVDKSGDAVGGASEKTDNWGKKITIGLIVAITAATAAIGTLVKKGLDAQAALGGAAISTGIAASQISKFEDVAARSGMSVADFAKNMSDLNKKMVEAAASDDDTVFDKLGVSVVDTNGKLRATSDVTVDVAKKIAAMSTEAEKYSTAAKVGFDGKVQVLEDIAHASSLAASTTDEQAGAVVRLGKIWHDIIPGGKSMWAQISDFLTASLTPAMTTASLAILNSKNKIVEAFDQIFSSGTGLARMGDQIKSWGDSAATWFAGVAQRATDATVNILKFIAAKTGLGNADAVTSGPAKTAVPGAVPLTGGAATAPDKASVATYDKLIESIKAKIAVQNQEISNQATLTEGQKLALTVMGQIKDGTLAENAAKKAELDVQLETLVAREKVNAQAKQSRADAEAAAAKAAATYLSLSNNIQGEIALLNAQIAAGKPLTELQKQQVKLNSDVERGVVSLSAAQVVGIRTQQEDRDAKAQYLATVASVRLAVQALTDEQDAAFVSLAAETLANQTAVSNFGLTKAAIEAVTVARLEDQLARRYELDLSDAYVSQLMREIAMRRKNAEALSQMDDAASAKKSAEDLVAFLDPAKAESFGDALAGAFGNAGSALSNLTKSFTTYASKQAEFEKMRGNAANKYLNGLSTEKQYQKDLGAVQAKQTAAQLGGYGDMAAGAAGFFGEQSKGYKALMAVSEVFHAAELAMTLAELVPKAISAILTQGTGDPYSAFARIAAMTAIVAGLGVAVSGGGGASSADVVKSRQAANGTGTVLGDKDAKSESIANSLKLVEDNTYRGLAISGDMLTSLRAIQSSLSGLGNLIVRTTGISTDLAAVQLGGQEKLFNSILGNQSIGEKLTGGALGKVVNGIFGGRVTTLDTGLTATKTTLGNAVANGVNAGQYTDTKKDGGLFSSDKYKTTITALGTEVNDQFAMVIKSMADGITSAAGVLSVGGDAFTARLNSFVVDLGKISLTGLTGDQIQSALEAAFSKLGDDMAKFAVGGLTQFQQVGEGAYETLVRIANDYATVDAVMASFGKSFGAVGLASVGARENLISLAGGLEDFVSQGSYFLDNFFTDQEKAATLSTAVSARLATVAGGASVTTVEQYKNLALAQDLTTTSGQAAYSTLMATAEAFKELVGYGNAAGKTLADIASERVGIQDQIDALTMTSMQLRAKEKATYDATNKTLYDQLQALNDLAAARTAETDALTAISTASKAAAASLTAVLGSLKQGTLSTLTPLQKLADAQGKYQQSLVAAQAKPGDSTLAAAAASAATAYLTADQIIKASSSGYAADSAKVQAELAALAANATATASAADLQLAALTAQANTMLAVDDSVRAGTTSIVAAIAALQLTGYMDGSHANGLTRVPFDGYRAELHEGEGVLTASQNRAYLSGQSGGSAGASSGNTDALVSEIRALRAEVAGLRKDQEQQTGYIADTVATSSAASADQITQGSKDAAMASVYADRLAPKELA